MKIPPAPESRSALVSTVLFPFVVLHVIGREMCIDWGPIRATSTEEIVSDPYVGVGRSPKNPHLPSFRQTLSSCLPHPYPPPHFVSLP